MPSLAMVVVASLRLSPCPDTTEPVHRRMEAATITSDVAIVNEQLSHLAFNYMNVRHGLRTRPTVLPYSKPASCEKPRSRRSGVLSRDLTFAQVL